MKRKNQRSIGGIRKRIVNKKITKIKKCKKKVVVYLGKEKLDLSFDTFSNFYLYEGKEFTSKEINEIKLHNESQALNKYAYNLFKKGRYSEWKIREKLYLKSADKKQVDIVINNLKKAGLIDDTSFMNDLYDYYSSKNYGKNKIIQALLDKGIFKEEIDKLSFPYDKEISKAKKLLPSLENKYSKYNNAQIKSHVYNALLSKGFDPSVAKEVSSLIKNKNNKDELSILKKDYQLAKNRLVRKYKGKELNDKIISSLLLKGYKYQDILKVRK